ncbi:EpsD family peptidyl-prolyl cis-trans isomerase [Glaciimonas sp. CA11.2]|uniref:EpsD family peptidyl-prolyl cis-trans isomerase n=1 Tax=Glaciimonas sp. CA11.2 TaxID=3048601 RepID=UPI002AB4AE7B|nr:EpsD family peptidyl-prolyl cis-trans isomerase [Glaciimonas sp. CA11.2]MDY7547131.1 EpsD family peptidyl-prolyl cis-trans isomerase [Glaciimonas sp. CA11.2]
MRNNSDTLREQDVNFANLVNFLRGNYFQLVIAPLSLRTARWLALLVTMSVMNLAACNDRKEMMSKTLVTVNGDAITARQLDAEVRFQNPIVRNQALEILINRKLLLTEALRQKTDRNPEVIDFIERLKTQVIVQTYLDFIGVKAAKPSNSEIDTYFKLHPELFAHRKILEIQQLSIAAQDYSVSIKQMMDNESSLSKIALLLDTQKIAYIKSTHSYTSGDMPTETIKNLIEMGSNHLFILENGTQSLLCALSAIRDSPLTIQDAAPQIEYHLFIEKMRKVAAIQIAKLRSSSKIDYASDSAQ